MNSRDILNCVCDHFGELGIKMLEWQVYLKAVTYINNGEPRLRNEQKKLWNAKYLHKWKNLQGAGKCISKFWTYLNHTWNKTNPIV